MKTKLLTGACIAIAAGLALAPAAMAQKQSSRTVDPSQRATYGDYRLNAGFPDDPYTIYVTSGGRVEASRVSSGCVGRVGRAPSAQLTYRAGDFPLIFTTQADSDTTLLINGPDGRWACDDDSGGAGNAQITYDQPLSGVYDIWVGAYSGSGGQAELLISELTTDSDWDDGDMDGTYPDASLPATYGTRSLRGGFTPDPLRVSLTAGGGYDASELGGGCAGMIAGAPDFELTYRPTSFDLTIGATSDRDTTLVVMGPDGNWYCDDDSAEAAFNPLIRFDNPRQGTYHIWVGTFGADTAPAQLYISELGED